MHDARRLLYLHSSIVSSGAHCQQIAATIDVGDIDRIIAGAEICSIGTENSAPALAGARIGHCYRAGAEICSDRATNRSCGARISAELLRVAAAEQSSMSGDIDRVNAGAGICSIGAVDSAPALEGARIGQFLSRGS
jgi:hypothetical protein